MQHNPTEVPTWDEFLRPILEFALEDPIMRRTATPAIADKYAFSDEIRSSRVKSGQTHIENRAGWAMSSLVKAEFITKHPTEKFTYEITESGRAYLKSHQDPITPDDLKKLDGYEEAAQVTQKSNDGGIDGIINEDRLGLDVIYVQAKRYQNKVGRVDIQNFVGALAGNQAHKGVFITTSDFNDNAVEFAKTVPQKVILIDGNRLANLMIEHNVGVSVEQVISIKKIDTDYFEEN